MGCDRLRSLRQRLRLERFALGEYCPTDACVLVGDRHDRLASAAPLPGRLRSGAQAVAVAVRVLQHRSRTEDQQRANVAVASLSDASQLRLAPA